MRFNPTPSEQRLFEAVRGGRLGVRFQRQVPMGRYIVDLFAPEVGLVIEIDGPYHARRRAADTRRERKLNRLGYRVLRLDAELVLTDLPAAVGRIRSALAEPP
jgi:very-short-patch-repair endonuclease